MNGIFSVTYSLNRGHHLCAGRIDIFYQTIRNCVNYTVKFIHYKMHRETAERGPSDWKILRTISYSYTVSPIKQVNEPICS